MYIDFYQYVAERERLKKAIEEEKMYLEYLDAKFRLQISYAREEVNDIYLLRGNYEREKQHAYDRKCALERKYIDLIENLIISEEGRSE